MSRGRRGSLLPPAHQLLHILLILLAEHTCSLFTLEQQIVGCCDVVKSVSLNFLLGLRSVNAVVLYQHANNLLVDWDRLVAQVDRRRVGRLMLVDGVPGVRPDILNREPLRRVRI